MMSIQHGQTHIVHFLPYTPQHLIGAFSGTRCGGYCYQTDLLPWLVKLEQQLRRNGVCMPFSKNKSIKVRIDITSEDTGIMKISKSSSSDALDQRALDLVADVFPVESPEVGLPVGKYLVVEFDYPMVRAQFSVPYNSVNWPTWNKLFRKK